MINKLIKRRTAVVFISGSAGELDWVLPILAFALKIGFNIKIIFLTNHARKSVEENQMLNDFICDGNEQIEIVLLGGYLFERIERLGYLSYRIFLKLKLGDISIINKIYSFYDCLLESLFIRHLPSDITHLKNEKYLFISEFPSLRRPRDNWIRKNFSRSIFFYCPHSPHIYADNLDRQYPESDDIDFDKEAFLLLGHPGDFFKVNDGRELAAPSLEKVFIGHPKYSASWLHSLRETAKVFRSNAETRDEIKILLVSRGFGNFFDENSHKKLVDSTINVIHNKISKYRLLVKKHPREISSHWDKVIDGNPSVEIVNDHIMELATKVDFVITFWGSGAMDCFSLGVPVIEYWDPNKHSKGQIPEDTSYTTIYRNLGIVFPANTEEELGGAISELVSQNFSIPSDGLHPFFIDLMNRSNQWDQVIKKILLSTNLIGQ
tara:strand:- start:171 stop:1475 length:1305 start_codon:yes stop_codon:yes gene_type:complete